MFCEAKPTESGQRVPRSVRGDACESEPERVRTHRAGTPVRGPDTAAAGDEVGESAGQVGTIGAAKQLSERGSGARTICLLRGAEHE